MERARVVTRDVSLLARLALDPVAGIKPFEPRPGTREPQGGRAALHEVVAQLRARQHLLVRAGLDHCVDQGVPAVQETRLVLVRRVVRELVRVEIAAVWERLVDGPRLQPTVGRREVLAARDRHRAQPILVGRAARRAVAYQGELLRVRSLAGGLLQGFVEAVV